MNKFLQQLSKEFSILIHNWGILLTVFGGVMFYAVLYPQPYLNNEPRNQTVAIVDHDNTSASRRLTRWIDASSGAQVVRHLNSIEEAKDLLVHEQIKGFIVIPASFMKETLLGKSPVIAMAGDANYFLVYGSIIEGAMGAVLTSAATIRVANMVVSGVPIETAAEHWLPIGLNARPLFNDSIGYLQYVIPAVFILLLHQTLLLGTGLLGAEFNQQLSSGEEKPGGQSAFHILASRFTLMFIIYLVLSIFYMGICFEYYGITRNANLDELWLMIMAFTGATTALGLLFGVLVPRTELIAPIVMISSLPLVFSAGFVWPLESVPWVIGAICDLAPSTDAIQGFLKLNQMGATFPQVFPHWVWLLFLFLLYSTSAWVILRRRLLRTAPV
jgi:ABC-2 type transport system permease protein